MIDYDWDIFTEKVDEEGQTYYSIVVDGETYNLDYGYAVDLLSRLTGHLPHSSLSKRITERDEY